MNCYSNEDMQLSAINFQSVYPAATKRLIELATTVPYSFTSLEFVKRTYNLTDYGVQEIIKFAAPRGLSIFDVAEAIEGYTEPRPLDLLHHRQ